jgi:hypothetical protein
MFNSHKLTEVKKLLAVGYFDNSSTNLNVWFSDMYGRDLKNVKASKTFQSKDILKMSWNLLYSSSFARGGTGNNFISTANGSTPQLLNQLSFYESSFHFILHRLKFFNTLQSNKITNTPALRDLREPGSNYIDLNFMKHLTHNLFLKNELSTVRLKGLNPSTPTSTTPLTNGAQKDLVFINLDKDL